MLLNLNKKEQKGMPKITSEIFGINLISPRKLIKNKTCTAAGNKTTQHVSKESSNLASSVTDPQAGTLKSTEHGASKLDSGMKFEQLGESPLTSLKNKFTSIAGAFGNNDLDFLKNNEAENKRDLKGIMADGIKDARPSTLKANDNACPGSSKANENSALKITGQHSFKPEEFIELAINEQINVLGLQQQQIIANQCKLAVAIDMKKCQTSTVKNGLSMDETLLIKKFFPISDPHAFESFDDNLRNDESFREKIWQYLQCCVNHENWRDTVRKIIGGVMRDSLQALYSCAGQKGKIAFKNTFLYVLVEVSATVETPKKYRATEKQVKAYVSEFLKHANTRLGLYDKENGKVKNRKENNVDKGKQDRKRIALSLVNKDSLEDEEADESS